MLLLEKALKLYNQVWERRNSLEGKEAHKVSKVVEVLLVLKVEQALKVS